MMKRMGHESVVDQTKSKKSFFKSKAINWRNLQKSYFLYLLMSAIILLLIISTRRETTTEKSKKVFLKNMISNKDVELIKVNEFYSKHASTVGNLNDRVVVLQAEVDEENKAGGNNGSLKHAFKTPKPILAICAPSHSIASWNSLSSTSLLTTLIPSIERTVTEAEKAEWDVRLYLGFDHDDKFWLAHHKNLSKPEWLTIYCGFYEVPEHRVPFNEMTRHAFEDNAEYIVRINDDTEFITQGWISKASKTLLDHRPENFGVVGPTCKEGNTAIMTHDMVHRTHLQVFENYYPKVFSAWWIDDWITKVYQNVACSTQLNNWVVKHHTGKHGTRYKVQHQEASLLQNEVNKGRKEIQKWLIDHTKSEN